ncbi:hypothetical protein TNCT_77781 [Trichonephila clavata]|uniref:Uncharacterized protein n=1 Tax=Trichonephila clavata TaxID=2740835 RepID=A0A8X6G9Z0_TRICU|nr:hypothetical protein TNCT_77781 [Trichonephila clavata]
MTTEGGILQLAKTSLPVRRVCFDNPVLSVYYSPSKRNKLYCLLRRRTRVGKGAVSVLTALEGVLYSPASSIEVAQKQSSGVMQWPP